MKSPTNNLSFAGQVRPHLSRRKARKLAYRHKGSRLGDRYRAFLTGSYAGFWIEGKRLVKEPRIVRRPIVTLHAQ